MAETWQELIDFYEGNNGDDPGQLARWSDEIERLNNAADAAIAERDAKVPKLWTLLTQGSTNLMVIRQMYDPKPEEPEPDPQPDPEPEE